MNSLPLKNRNRNILSQNKPDRNSILVRYLITTKLEPRIAAAKLCNEQSLNAPLSEWKSLKVFAAKYVPSSIKITSKNQFTVDIVFPSVTFGESLSMIINAIGGDAFNIKDMHPIKIISVKLPKSIIKHYGGPKYGVEGIRKLLDCYNRPILMGPVKPAVGLNLKNFVLRAKSALIGGVDIVKDDELICDPVYNPFLKRVKAMFVAVKEAERISETKKMYFAFIGSGAPSQIFKYAAIAKNNGVDGLMVAPAINGFEIVKDLKDKFGLPIIVHNALSYSAQTKSHGYSFSFFSLIQRICGADIILTLAKNGPFDVLGETEYQETIANISFPIVGVKRSLPAFSGGQLPQDIPKRRREAGGNDFIIISGSAIYDHCDGPEMGAKLFQEYL